MQAMATQMIGHKEIMMGNLMDMMEDDCDIMLMVKPVNIKK